MNKTNDSKKRKVEWMGQTYLLPKPSKGRITSNEDMEEIAGLILEMYATGQYTMQSCCEKCGIDQSTLHYWRQKNPRIQEIYELATDKASDEYFELVSKTAKDTVMKVVRGDFVRTLKRKEDIIEVVDGVETVTARRVTETEQWLKPSTNLLLSLLELTEPEKYSKAVMLQDHLNGAKSDSILDILDQIEIDDSVPGESVPLLGSEEEAREYGKRLKRPNK